MIPSSGLASEEPAVNNYWQGTQSARGSHPLPENISMNIAKRAVGSRRPPVRLYTCTQILTT